MTKTTSDLGAEMQAKRKKVSDQISLLVLCWGVRIVGFHKLWRKHLIQ